MIHLKAYFGALVAFTLLDLIWLGLIARGWYAEQLGDLMRPQTNWAAAVPFYLIYIAGIVFFAVAPALDGAGGWQSAALRGAALGFLAYATFDLTAAAVLRDWPLPMTFVDLAWGTVLTAGAATGGFLAAGLGSSS